MGNRIGKVMACVTAITVALSTIPVISGNTIKGAIEAASVEIGITTELQEISVATQNELVKVIQDGGKAVLTTDIVLDADDTNGSRQVVQVGKKVTIDTNGHRITMTNAYLGAKGELTITGGGIIVADRGYQYDSLIYGYKGSIVNIENVTVNANSYSKRVAFFLSCTVTINEASFTGGYNSTSEPCAGVEITGRSKATINSGSITGNRYVGTLNKNAGYNDPAKDLWLGAQARVVINGGTFGDVYANQNKYSAESDHPGSVVINNGSFEKVWVEYYGGYLANVRINSGKINQLVLVGGKIPMLYGGTYTKITTNTGTSVERYIAKGYVKVKNTDGTYSIVKAPKEPTTVKPAEDNKSIKLFKKHHTRFGYIKNISKRKIKVKISKVSGAYGYVLKWSTSKKMKKSKTKNIIAKKNKKRIYAIKKLKKGKRYYLRARAYKYINGKKIYAKWTVLRTKRVIK